MRPVLPFVTVAVLLAAGPTLGAAAPDGAPGPGAAQAQPDSASAPAAPAAAPAAATPPAVAPTAPAAATAAAEEPRAEPGEIRVKAESYEQRDKGHMEARGTVDLRMSDVRILADKADVFEQPQPDGTTRRRVVAEGNVVFIRGEERLAGDRAEIDDTGHGFFDNATGYVEPGVFIEARRIERVDADTYKAQGARFTSCSQPNPRWKFSASRARIEVNDKIVATNTVLRVKGVPAFYLPYLQYPIQKDGRSSGLLMPHFGHSSVKGYELGTGFFWVMGRSADQTFYGDYWSRMGNGFGHELRYRGTSPSRANFRTYLFRVRGEDAVVDPLSGQVITAAVAPETDWDLDWNAVQVLPGAARATLNVRKSSNLLFRQRFQENFAGLTSRSQRWSGGIERDFKFAVLSAYADSNSTAYGTSEVINERAPGLSLRRFPRGIGWGGVLFGLNASAERLRYGNQDEVRQWTRADFSPTLSRPFNVSFLEFNPALSYRVTRYGTTLGTRTVVDEEGEPVLDEEGNETTESGFFGPPLTRRFMEASVEMRGPTFARVFDAPGSGYSQRYKHTIGPEVSWVYRTRVEDAESIPKFGGEDYLYGENQLSYALVQRFYAKRPGPTGRMIAYEFFSWRLMQSYYVKISEGQNAGQYDPNYSSSAFGPGSRPEHLSPISSRMRLRPTPEYALDYQLEYDVNFKQLRRMGASADFQGPRVSLRASWSRSLRLSEVEAERTLSSHTLRGETQLDLVPRKLSLTGGVDYDLKAKILYHLRGELRYQVQCCGLSVEHSRYDWNGVVDQQWRFHVELANISAIGGFMGADARGGPGLGAYR